MEAKLAWLAGIIDGEGSVTVQVIRRNGSETAIRCTPFVAIVNTDRGVINGCAEVLREVGINFDVYERENYNNALSVKKIWTLRINAGKRLKVLLPFLLPHLRSVKRDYAEKILEFIRLRETHLFQHDARGHIRRREYTRAELELVASVRTHPRARSLAALHAASNVVQ
jgi:hypothetical protein